MAGETAVQFNKQFGIKEVADVGFYTVGTVKVEADGTITATADPVLEFDTLKVSNIEMTAEQADARGGKGNAPLIIWDYGREITLNIEDALMSMPCLERMFGETAGGDNIITINASNFPGTYAIVGKTYARDIDGHDHIFTFYVEKAKINSEVTLTMEAEGDPTVFSMSLRVLRGTNGDMVKLVLDPNVTTSTGSLKAALPRTAGT